MALPMRIKLYRGFAFFFYYNVASASHNAPPVFIIPKNPLPSDRGDEHKQGFSLLVTETKHRDCLVFFLTLMQRCLLHGESFDSRQTFVARDEPFELRVQVC